MFTATKISILFLSGMIMPEVTRNMHTTTSKNENVFLFVVLQNIIQISWGFVPSSHYIVMQLYV
jgi:hypothetical protein